MIRNKCYFLVFAMDQQGNVTTKSLIDHLTKTLVARPKFVLVMTQLQNDNTISESFSFPLIHLTSQRQVSLTCPGCGTTHHGLWSKRLPGEVKGVGSFTNNLRQPLCCHPLRGMRFRTSYNNYGKSWNMKNNDSLDPATYEGWLMDTFAQKYQLRMEFLNANWKWGAIDKKTGLWNGGIGNVRGDFIM